MSDNKIQLGLTRDEAIVLYEWLVRNHERESLPQVHPAEGDVFVQIEAQLDKALHEIFADDYKELVASARERIRPGGAEQPPV